MQQYCSKCEEETSYSSDLHCRSILIGGVKKLLSLGKSKEAKDLILSSSGDENWEKWKEETFDRIYFEHKRQMERVRFEEEEEREKERKARIIEILASAQSLLNNGNFFEADQFVLEKHSEELFKEYERKKFECVQTDLHNLV